jgi:hypothetical protein
VELHKLNLRILSKLGITMIQRIKKNGGWKLRKSSITLMHSKFGKISRKNIFQKEEELSIVNGPIKSKETKFLEPESLHMDTVKFQMLISRKVWPLVKMLSIFRTDPEAYNNKSRST